MKRNWLVIATLMILLVSALSANLLLGPAQIRLSDLGLMLLEPLLPAIGPALEGVPQWQETILWQVRLPRALTAAMVGAALAVSGAVLQGLFRNPLASPSVLGVSSGATLGAALALFFGLASLYAWSLPLFAFAGALVTLFLVYSIASHRGSAPIASLLLAGIAVGAFNGAITAFLIALALESWEVGRAILYWTMGGLDGRTWDQVLIIAPVLLFAGAAVLAFQRDLDALLLGEVHASAVGVDVARTRLLLLGLTALLIGAAVAVSGGIGFIGLVVPHIIRLLVGPGHRLLLPLSAIGGALVLVSADLLLRAGFSEHNLPIGVITAALGAPFFLFLLVRHQLRVTRF